MADKNNRGNESISSTSNVKSIKHSSCDEQLQAPVGGLEKSQPKRAKPNPVMPTKAIDIDSLSSDTMGIVPSLDEKLPLWVAGASPAKFISLEDVININNSLEKMAIVHEIAIDPKFSVEDLQKKDQVYDAVKSSMHKAYWDMLRTEISKNPPNYEHAFILLKDLKDLITEQLVTGNLNNALSAVGEILDLEHLKSLLDRKMLDFKEVLKLVLQVLQRLCAPIRDEFVHQLKAEEDLVELFRGIFELLEQMKIDMANFALSQNRGTIESYASQIEREEFIKTLQLDPTQYTERWLQKIYSNFCLQQSSVPSGSCSNCEAKNAGQLTQSQINDLIIMFYLTLLEIDPNNLEPELQFFPETLKLDEHRFLALGEKFLQLILTTASMFVTSNLAGKSVCENPNFKSTLKNELIVVLNDVSWQNYIEKLENVFLQCEKNIKNFDTPWNDEKSMLLQCQIRNLKSPDNTIRRIARNRICDFLQLVMRRAGDQLKLPPGLGAIQSELAAFTSKFYAIVLHNWNAFGSFYADILRKLSS